MSYCANDRLRSGLQVALIEADFGKTEFIEGG